MADWFRSLPPTKSRHRVVRWLAACALAWLVVAWIVLWGFGDRAWWTVLIVFGPRWLLALPWLGTIPWLVVEFRRAAIPVACGFAIAVIALCGWRPGLHRASVRDGIPLRVLELNAAGGHTPAIREKLLAELQVRDPDLAIIAECGSELAATLTQVEGYQFRTGDELCLLSRGEILDWVPRDQHDIWRQNGAGAIVRATVMTPAGRIRIGLVHLATPRNALDAYFDLSELWKQGPRTRANMVQRDLESSLARKWIFQGTTLPAIIAGDFNMPFESAIYRRHWGDLRDAYSRGGRGTGYTKFTRYWGVRIDHVLTTTDIETHAAFIGRDVGADHVPVIADLVVTPHQ